MTRGDRQGRFFFVGGGLPVVMVAIELGASLHLGHMLRLQSTAVVGAAKWQAAATWRETKQPCVGSTAVVGAAKWEGAIK